jgi:hypothetical protein
VKHLLLKGKPLQMKKCLKNISMKKFSKKIPMKFLMLKTLDETLVSIFSLEEDEVVKPCEEVINSNDIGKFMEQPSDTVDNHIDDFICVWKHGWDIGCFGFDGDPIYDIEGNFQIKNAEIFLWKIVFHTWTIKIFGNLMMI